MVIGLLVFQGVLVHFIGINYITISYISDRTGPDNPGQINWPRVWDRSSNIHRHNSLEIPTFYYLTGLVENWVPSDRLYRPFSINIPHGPPWVSDGSLCLAGFQGPDHVSNYGTCNMSPLGIRGFGEWRVLGLFPWAGGLSYQPHQTESSDQIGLEIIELLEPIFRCCDLFYFAKKRFS